METKIAFLLRHHAATQQGLTMTLERRLGSGVVGCLRLMSVAMGIMKPRPPRWRVFVALVAAYALVLQALLSSVDPGGRASAHPLDGSFAVVCLLSGNGATPDKAPEVPNDHRHACCILCAVPGLDATGTEIRIAMPDDPASHSSPVAACIDASPPGARALSPIQPRAPPHLI